MKKEYIKPNARLIEIEVTGIMLAGSDPTPTRLRKVNFSDDEAEGEYEVL